MVCLCIGCKWMKFDDLKLHILTVRRKACFAKILLDNFHAWNFIMPSPWQNVWAVETAGSKTEEVVRDADLETTLFVVTEELLAPWLNCLMPWPCLALLMTQNRWNAYISWWSHECWKTSSFPVMGSATGDAFISNSRFLLVTNIMLSVFHRPCISCQIFVEETTWLEMSYCGGWAVLS